MNETVYAIPIVIGLGLVALVLGCLFTEWLARRAIRSGRRFERGHMTDFETLLAKLEKNLYRLDGGGLLGSEMVEFVADLHRFALSIGIGLDIAARGAAQNAEAARSQPPTSHPPE